MFGSDNNRFNFSAVMYFYIDYCFHPNFSITFSITLTQLFIKFVAFRGNLFKLTLLIHIIPNNF